MIRHLALTSFRELSTTFILEGLDACINFLFPEDSAEFESNAPADREMRKDCIPE